MQYYFIGHLFVNITLFVKTSGHALLDSHVWGSYAGRLTQISAEIAEETSTS